MLTTLGALRSTMGTKSGSWASAAGATSASAMARSTVEYRDFEVMWAPFEASLCDGLSKISATSWQTDNLCVVQVASLALETIA
jgi:hypothetical protein